jgi:hypothetical protein
MKAKQVQCTECRELVLSDARKCKHCGSALIPQPPAKKMSGLKKLALSIVAFFVLVYVMGNRPAPAPPTPEQLQAKAEKQKIKDAEAVVEAKRDREITAVALGAKAIQSAMKNPKSFELVKAVLMPSGAICYEYRGTNSFNAIVTNQFVMAEKGGGESVDAWNRHCAGKRGTDYAKDAQTYL